VIVAHALYLIAPAVIAGCVHALVIKRDAFNRLAVPLDRGSDVFGENKTWRGVVVMVVVSTAAAAAIGLSPALGACLGAAYSLAELPNSFVKRRLGIAPGARASAIQYVADQGDSAAGCTLALIPFAHSAALLATVSVVGFGVHAAVDALLYVFGVKHLREAAA
jgi:hypothetical protein